LLDFKAVKLLFIAMKIPIWINVLGAVLVCVGLFAAYSCYFDISGFIPGYLGDTVPTHYAAWELGARNLTMALVLLIALLSQKPQMLKIAFIMRALTEPQDLIIGLTTGGTGLPPLNLIILVLVFLIPEVLAIIKLNKLDNNSNSFV